MSNSEREILIVYYTRHGATAELARHVARGVVSVAGAAATLRTVPPVSAGNEVARPLPENGPPYATLADLKRASAVILGSPAWFGGMAAPLKHFLDSTSALWLEGALAGKPAAAFTSTQTQHGGHEMALFSMLVPLMHQGMILVGLPYTESALTRTAAGGAPYGAGHVMQQAGATPSADEQSLCQALGRRVAELTLRLAASAPAPRG
ncbi:MAG: NAD(P)H:quinone oxidoreductase [Steroidobacteraceae bacterium]